MEWQYQTTGGHHFPGKPRPGERHKGFGHFSTLRDKCYTHSTSSPDDLSVRATDENGFSETAYVPEDAVERTYVGRNHLNHATAEASEVHENYAKEEEVMKICQNRAVHRCGRAAVCN